LLRSIGQNAGAETRFSSTHGSGWNDYCEASYSFLHKEGWNYVVGVYDGSSTASIYLNGELRDQQTWSSVSSTSYGLRMGGWSSYMEGLLDEIRIYDRELTPQEISERYILLNGTSVPTPDIPGIDVISFTDEDGDYSIPVTMGANTDHYELFENGISIYSGVTDSISITGKVNGTYVYTVRGINDVLVSDNSVGVTITVAIPAWIFPDMPSFTTTDMQDEDGTYTINFTGGAKTTHYTLLENGLDIYTGPLNGIELTGRVNGTYTYKVVARNGNGSTTSAEILTVNVYNPSWVLPDEPSFEVVDFSDLDGDYSITVVMGDYTDTITLLENGNEVYTGVFTAINLTSRLPGTYVYELIARNENGSTTSSEVLTVLVTVPDVEPDPIDLDDGLVAYWSFDHGIARDETGNGNEGIVHGTFSAEGYSSGGLSFDGIDDFIDLGHNPDLQLDEMSVSLWFNTSSSQEQSLFRFSYYGHFLKTNGDGSGTIIWGMSRLDGPSSKIISDITVSDGTWHHLVGTLNGTEMSLYIDGELVSTIVPQGVPYYEANGKHSIGRSGKEDLQYTDGRLDEVRFYSRVLSSSEVSALNDIEAIPSTDLVAHWSFNEGKGSVLVDRSGNGNDGVIHGAFYVPGLEGTALSFDGINDHVSVPFSDSLSMDGAFSVEAWYLPESTGKGNPILIKGNSNTQPRDYGLGQNAYAEARFSSTHGSGWNEFCDAPHGFLDQDGWNHIVGVYDGGSTASIYLNGELRDEQTWYSISTSQYGIEIGGWSSFMEGLVDEIRIYRRALTAEEISTRYGYFNTTNGIDPTVISDVTPPVITVENPMINTDELPIWINGTVSDDIGVVTNEYSMNGMTWIPLPTTGDWMIQMNGMAEGSHILLVRCYDAAGNWDMVTVTVDYFPPVDTSGDGPVPLSDPIPGFDAYTTMAAAAAASVVVVFFRRYGDR